MQDVRALKCLIYEDYIALPENIKYATEKY